MRLPSGGPVCWNERKPLAPICEVARGEGIPASPPLRRLAGEFSLALDGRGDVVGAPFYTAGFLANCTRPRMSCHTRRPMGPELYCATAIVRSGFTTNPVACRMARRIS